MLAALWLPTWSAVGHICEYGSAVFGILGTALMSRRLVPHFGRWLGYVAFYPVLFLFGQGNRARKFFIARAKVNWDVPDTAADMTLGINLLFWAFILQLASLLAK